MATLRRPTRPADCRMGLVYGEDPRPVQHTEGPHAGHTVVQVQVPQAVARLEADGWVLVDGAGPVVPSGPVTLAEAVVRGTLADVQAQLVPGLDPDVVREALNYEIRAQARPEVMGVLGQYLEDVGATRPATLVLPADPQAPLDPTVRVGEGPQATATAAPRRKRAGTEGPSES